eukprot:6204615-Pleurochrysis_carterae.AAC.6
MNTFWIYRGLKPHVINHDLHIRGNRHHIKHSCQSDASDRVAGNIPHIAPSAYIARPTRSAPGWAFAGGYIPLLLKILTFLSPPRTSKFAFTPSSCAHSAQQCCPVCSVCAL